MIGKVTDGIGVSGITRKHSVPVSIIRRQQLVKDKLVVAVQRVNVIDAGIVADSDATAGFEFGFFSQGQRIVYLCGKEFVVTIAYLLLLIAACLGTILVGMYQRADEVVVVIRSLAIVDIGRQFFSCLGESMLIA